jgi:AbrB family looped-hinge helix DNA binding protein
MTAKPTFDALQMRVTMAENGRVLVPAELRAALGLRSGGPVMVRLEGERLVLEPLSTAVRRIQGAMRQYSSSDVSLVDELIAERRREAESE